MPPRNLFSELKTRYQLAGSRRGKRRVHAVGHDPRVVKESETAGQQAIGASGRRRGAGGARVRNRQVLVQEIEELGADTEGHALANFEDFPETAGDDRTALGAKIVVINDIAAGDAGRLILPRGGIQNRLLSRVDAAAVRIFEIKRYAGHSD